jgi:hypothetical protein
MSAHTIGVVGPGARRSEEQVVRPASVTEIPEPFDDAHGLVGARSVALGILLSLPFWFLVCLATWFWL